ncbi:MAG: phosphoribosylamine--glycine ligase, partial [Pygmaiobacter sp.]
MKVAVIGGGGREHAIIKKLKESKEITELFALPGNGGISYDATCVPIKATDLDGVCEFVQQNGIEFVVVAPDDPLVAGLVDKLEALGVPCFGPDQKAAIIEGSKVFSKDLMKKYNIPTASYATFECAGKAIDYLKTSASYPIVLKADGLALGKGVLICDNFVQAVAGVKTIMQDKAFGSA